jgi:cytochrome c oxidase assembly factor CtaG
MSELDRTILEAWSLPPWPTALSLLGLVLYWRGWRVLHRTRPQIFPTWRLMTFLGGLGVLYIALGSPLDAYDDVLLSVHMMQHLLLMSIVPPLLLLGYPMAPILRGLPRWAMRGGLHWVVASRTLRRVGHTITRPAFAWLVMITAFFGWHAPGPYELALRSENWHDVEHACFLVTSSLFWWPVIRPWPSLPRRPRWFLLPYLLSADIANTVLCALFVFSSHLFYPYYATVQTPVPISPMQDQVAAGVLMWVFGSLPMLTACVAVTVELLTPPRKTRPLYAGLAPRMAAHSK